MMSVSWRTEVNDPRRITWRVMAEKKHSTRLTRSTPVAVKCRVTLGLRASQALTSACLWVEVSSRPRAVRCRGRRRRPSSGSAGTPGASAAGRPGATGSAKGHCVPGLAVRPTGAATLQARSLSSVNVIQAASVRCRVSPRSLWAGGTISGWRPSALARGSRRGSFLKNLRRFRGRSRKPGNCAGALPREAGTAGNSNWLPP